MTRLGFILILHVVVLIGSLPMSASAENELMGLVQAQMEGQKARMQLQREIRQQRADAQAEVLFWFRTHPTDRVFPQTEIDRMLKSGGYNPAAVEGLTGSRNPFFSPISPSQEAHP